MLVSRRLSAQYYHMSSEPVKPYRTLHYWGRLNEVPAYLAASPSSSSILNSWLYLATLSDLHGAPVLIWNRGLDCQTMITMKVNSPFFQPGIRLKQHQCKQLIYPYDVNNNRMSPLQSSQLVKTCGNNIWDWLLKKSHKSLKWLDVMDKKSNWSWLAM